MPTLSKNINGLKGPILVMGASGFVGANLFNTIKKYRDDIYAVVQHEKNWRLKDVKDEFKKIMKPVIDMLMQEIYPYIFISILLVLISFLLILGIFILLLRSKLIINALKKI